MAEKGKLGMEASAPGDARLHVVDYPDVKTYDRDSVLQRMRDDLDSAYEVYPFKTLVNLKYVEGRKYTIGNTFVSRREQGEYLFFPQTTRHPQRPRPGDDGYECELIFECRDGGYWTTWQFRVASRNEDGKRPSSRVFAIPGYAPRKLRSGDVISFSSQRPGNPLIHIFLFMPSNDDLWKDEKGNTTEEKAKFDRGQHPLQNPLVVSKVLSNLPSSDWKGLRLVSPVWNREALLLLRDVVTLRVLKDRSPARHTLFIDYNYLLQMPNLAHSEMMMRVLDGFPMFSSWTLELPHLRSPGQGDADEFGLMIENKILEDLAWFASPPFQHQNYVTDLTLTGIAGPTTNLRLYTTLLGKLAGTLTNLKVSMISDALEIRPSTRTDKDAFLSEPIPTLDCLRTLTLSCPGVATTLVLKLFGSSLGPALVANIETLRLPFSPQTKNDAAAITKILLDVYLTNGGVFKKLKDFSSGRVTSLTVQLTRTTPVPPPPLKKLHLMYIDLLKDARLKSYLKDHLEELVIHIEDVSQATELPLSLPDGMKALTSLSILIHAPSVRGASFVFGDTRQRSNVFDYPSFPALKKLVIWPVAKVRNEEESLSPVRNSGDPSSWTNFLPLLQGFLPSVSQNQPSPAEGLTQVDIPFSLRGKYHAVLNNLEATFPNCVFPQELITARSQPVYKEDDAVTGAPLFPYLDFLMMSEMMRMFGGNLGVADSDSSDSDSD